MRREGLLASCRFAVMIRGSALGFRSISGIKLSASFEPLQVGGQNDAPVMLAIPVKEPGKLVMERGVSPAGALSNFRPGEKIADEMQIDILNENGEASVSYSVASPVVESIELSKLDAQDSSVLIETFSVFHGGIALCRPSK
ncbi:MAG: phage tail protein [Oscillospiraceae bacterium]|jgi:phage tail-like protein|nr:phage tail protein [Oscillospiraceae bacterium]